MATNNGTEDPQDPSLPDDFLSREEAIHFLQTVLEISDVPGKLANNKSALAEEIIVAFQKVLPFQNVSFMCQCPEQRGRPTLSQVKDDILSLKGGLCFEQNTFIFFLLRVIGFTVYLSQGTVYPDYPNSHVITILCSLLKNGDRHLVDISAGFPTFQLIPLDFERESPVYKHSFLQYKFVKDKGQLYRLHKHTNTTVNPFRRMVPEHIASNEWRCFYNSSLSLRKWGDYLDDCSFIYKNPNATSFHSTVKCILFPNKRALVVSKNKLVTETETGELQTQILASGGEIINTILKFFPKFSKITVEAAVKNCPDI